MRRPWMIMSGALLVVSMVVSVGVVARSASPERIGIVNASRIIDQLPDYQRYSQQYAAEQSRSAGARGKRLAEARRSLTRWQAIKTKFIASSLDSMRSAAARVAREKHISFVLLDAPWNPGYPLAQQGAIDITTDVLFAMQGR